MKSKFIIFTVLAIVAPSSATTQTEPDSEYGPKGNYDSTWHDISIIEAKEQTALRTIREGTELIFATIKEELVVRFAHGFGNGDKRCRIVTEDVEEKVYEIYAVGIRTFFDATFVIHPEASSIIAKSRISALADLRASVAGIVEGMALIDEYHGDDIRTKIDVIEKETMEICERGVRNIYVPIRNVQDCSTIIGAKLHLAEEKSVAALIASISGIFRGTRSVLAKAFPDDDFGVSDCSSFDTIENGTLSNFHQVVRSIYQAEDILLNAKSEKPMHTSHHLWDWWTSVARKAQNPYFYRS